MNLVVLVYGSKSERNSLGFTVSEVSQKAKFQFKQFTKGGFYIGRHLVSWSFVNEIYFQRPKIIIAHELGLNTFVALIFKLILKSRVYVTLDDSPDIFNKKSKIKIKLLWIIKHYANGIFVVNEKVIDNFQKKFGQGTRMLFLPLVQDEARLLSPNIAADELPKSIGKNDKVILFVGRMIEQKGPDILLDCFKLLNDISTKLVFIGEGPLLEILENQVKNSLFQNRVHFLGKLLGSSLLKWYKRADVFVLPSRFEPFGAVVNEALIFGCYVIVSDVVGSSCLVNKENGDLFESGSTVDLYRSLNHFLNRINKVEKENKMPFKFEEVYNKFFNFIKY